MATRRVRYGRIVAVVVVAGFLVGQLVLPARTNPPDKGPIAVPEEVAAVLRRSCDDCHSNHTVWPWYAKVFPSGLLVGHHVIEGREHLNFSEWDTYSDARKSHKLEEIVEVVDEGEMPPPDYLWLHPDARLSPADVRLITSWAGKDD